LVHRAVAGGDVRPRIAARFEARAPMEQLVERESEAPPTEPVRAPPREAASPERAKSPPPPAVLDTTERVTRHETRVVERISDRDATMRAPAPPPESRARWPEAPPSVQMVEHASAAVSAPSAPAAALLVVTAPLPQPTTRVETTREIVRTTGATNRSGLLEPPPTLEQRAAPRDAPSQAPAVPRDERRASPEPAAPAPIEIVIGRIEIRAEPPAAAPRAPTPARRTGPSLSEYLRGREGSR
jgi:hypothetical protein